MTTYVEQLTYAPTREKTSFSYANAVVYTPTSGAASGDELTGTGEVLVISSDVSGWLHISDADDDVAAIAKTYRILPDQQRTIAGVRAGLFISILEDA